MGSRHDKGSRPDKPSRHDQLDTLRAIVRPLTKKRQVEGELDHELSFHLEMEAAKNRDRGLSESEAERKARLDFGSVEGAKEGCRESRRVHGLETWGQDLRYAWRSLTSRPGVTVAAVLTLALGIGLNGSVGSAISGVLLQPLPYTSGKELLELHHPVPKQNVEDDGFSVPEIADLRELAKGVTGVVEIHSMSFHLLGWGEPLRVKTGVVSAGWFDTLGVKPLLGRTFLAGDEHAGAEPVLVLSNDFWHRLGGDPGLVGKTFEMNDRTHTVVGVLPSIPQYPSENDVYMPTSACPFRSSPGTISSRTARGYALLARLAPGVSPAAATVELNHVQAGLAARYPEAYPADRPYEIGVTTVFDELTRVAKPALLLLWAMAMLVLVAAAANVASLTLARLLGRREELALRVALGAPAHRIARQLVIESCLTALTAGVLGLLLTALGQTLLIALLTHLTRRAPEIGLDRFTVAYVLLVSLATGLALGALTASQALHSAPGKGLRRGANPGSAHRGHARLRSALVVAQVAASVILVAGTALVVRSLIRLEHVDPGFEPAGLLAARVDIDWSHRRAPEQRHAFYDLLLDKLATLPSVEGVALASGVPLDSQLLGSATLTIENQATAAGELPRRADITAVTPAYFDLLRVPLLAGRGFAATDRANTAPVVLINRLLAVHLANGADPTAILGRRLSLNGGRDWGTVVGVVGDMKQAGLASAIHDEVFVPFNLVPGFSAEIILKSAADPKLVDRELRRALHELDPEQPLAEVRTLADVRGDSLAPPRLTAALLALCATFGLAISALGLGGLLAHSVAQRRHEIGVRIALGAARGSVLAMVLLQGLTLVAGGLVLGVGGGLLISAWAGPVLSTFLFEVQPSDPLALGAGVLALLVVALVACGVPAQRATAVDPMQALRSE